MRDANLWATAVRVAPDHIPSRSRDGWQVRPVAATFPVVRGIVAVTQWLGMGVAGARWALGPGAYRPAVHRVVMAGATVAVVGSLAVLVIGVPMAVASLGDGGGGLELLVRLLVVAFMALVAWIPVCASTTSYAGARNQVLASARTAGIGADLITADVRVRSPRAPRNAVTIGWLLALALFPISLVVGDGVFGLLARLVVVLPILGVVDELLRLTDPRPGAFVSRLLALPAVLIGMRPQDEHREVAIEAWHAVHLEKTIALTFDDGPHPEFTLRIAEALDQRGVQATFFVVGERAAQHPDIVRTLAAAGHSVQNHSLTHVDLRELDDAGFATEVDGASDVLARLVARPNCVRPPFGRHDHTVVERLERRGLRMVLWDISVLDWKQQPARWIAGEIAKRAEPGSVVLLHDGGGDREQTVRAVPMLVDSLVGRGYRFVCID